MLNSNFRVKRKKQKGMAAMEIIPVIIVAVLLLNYTLGFFGAIHTGILNSIAARNYLFETFRNRSNLTWFRDTKEEFNKNSDYFGTYGLRFSGIISENDTNKANPNFNATIRSLAFAGSLEKLDSDRKGTQQEHNSGIDTYFGNAKAGGNPPAASPIWIRTRYGICLNLKCGDTK